MYSAMFLFDFEIIHDTICYRNELRIDDSPLSVHLIIVGHHYHTFIKYKAIKVNLNEKLFTYDLVKYNFFCL